MNSTCHMQDLNPGGEDNNISINHPRDIINENKLLFKKKKTYRSKNLHQKAQMLHILESTPTYLSQKKPTSLPQV